MTASLAAQVASLAAERSPKEQAQLVGCLVAFMAGFVGAVLVWIFRNRNGGGRHR
jgi:hypothetical protein